MIVTGGLAQGALVVWALGGPRNRSLRTSLAVLAGLTITLAEMGIGMAEYHDPLSVPISYTALGLCGLQGLATPMCVFKIQGQEGREAPSFAWIGVGVLWMVSWLGVGADLLYVVVLAGWKGHNG